MKQNLTQKLIESHLISGKMNIGEEISIKIDQTLTQDATGTMAYLQFEAMDIPTVKTELSVSYIDHNTLQTGFENADDHRFLRTLASKYGIYFSRPGNGICHQVHLERFGIPGKTLLGSDSHTPTAGGIGMLAIGSGGLDIAAAMAGMPFYLTMPEVLNIKLTGKRPDWVSAKDIILEILRKLSVKGGVGKIIEYSGEGILDLSIPERATITNMGAELGATTSIFPSDDITKRFLDAQNRAESWLPLAGDEGAEYDDVIELNLSELEPMAAQPHSPDNVDTIKNIGGIKVDQVFIGSCTNGSFSDLVNAAAILKNNTVHPDTDLIISPGSRQVYEMLARDGALADLIASGARIIECACGPCIGMGHSPPSNAVSVRTINRNFKGRSGTENAQVYLTGTEVAAATAITGKLTHPKDICKNRIKQETPKNFLVDDSMIIPPADNPEDVQVLRGPNIKQLSVRKEIPPNISGPVLLKLGDNITTDDILPAGAKILPLRSNIPAISEYVFSKIDPEFSDRAKKESGGFIVGGNNYGQGSSREHAAIAPMYLGVKAVIAKSFARIHKCNLVNFGIIPFTFSSDEDYEKIKEGNVLEIKGIKDQLKSSSRRVSLKNITKSSEILLKHDLSPRQLDVILSGGLLSYVKAQKNR